LLGVSVDDPSRTPAGAAAATLPWTRSRGVLALIAGFVVAFVVLVVIAQSRPSELGVFDAIVLGIVEGITEYLPVSSTGHLLVTQRLLGLGSGEAATAADTFAVAIQVGAIAAVLGLYWSRIWSMVLGLVGRDVDGRRLLIRILIAFTPAVVVGFLLEDTIKENLFGPWPIVAAWAVGGVVLLVWRPNPGTRSLMDMTTRDALIIGLAQVLATWPGTSRSLMTIIAALAIGLSMAAAVEFSFLLGLLTLTAATVFDLSQNGGEVLDQFGLATPLLGVLMAAASAALAVKWLVSYLRTRPLVIFGWYRLGIAAVTVLLITTGVIDGGR
jgi:undecaprenyl-diphosphatase